MTAQVIPLFDRRSEQVAVSRAALSAASENALASNRSAQEAVDRALSHVWANQRAAAVHELSRIGFELQGRLEALANLTRMAEAAPALTECPDGVAAPSHGAAA